MTWIHCTLELKITPIKTTTHEVMYDLDLLEDTHGVVQITNKVVWTTSCTDIEADTHVLLLLVDIGKKLIMVFYFRGFAVLWL